MFSRPIMLTVAVVSLGVFSIPTASAGSPRYRIIDLTERAPVQQSEARAINERGEVVGFELLPEYQVQAIFWDTNQDGYLLKRLKGDNSNTAFGINADGLVTGTSELVTIEHVGHQERIYYDSKATIWLNGKVTRLADLVRKGDDLELQWASAANAGGVITGVAKRPGEDGWHGFIFDDGLLTEMTGFPDGSLGVQPHALNETGDIVGEFFHGGTHAFLWSAGVVTDLHNDPLIRGVTSRAYKVNGAGQVVGEAQFLISNPESPVLWDNGVATDLVGDLFRRPQGIAMSINNAGQIIGFVKDLDDLQSPFEGFLIENGNYLRLLDLIPQDQGWDALLVPWDINDAGWIVGGGMRNGQLGHAWLMIPNE
jgi:uncharacterized membrane protein